MEENILYDKVRRLRQIRDNENALAREDELLRKELISYLTVKHETSVIVRDLVIQLRTNKLEKLSPILAKKFLTPEDLAQITIETEQRTLLIKEVK